MPSTKSKSSKNPVPNAPSAPNPPCLELEAFKAAAKGKNALLTPFIDKAGAWTWRGKELERLWDAIVAGGNAIEKTTPEDDGAGSFTERFEITSGDMKVYGGSVRSAPAAKEDSFHVGFAVLFAAGKAGDAGAVQKVFELPPPLAFVAAHLLTTLHKVLFTQEKVLALLSPKATSARADVMEGIVWMRERLAAVERSPQAMLTRCIELQKTAKEMHAHYLK